VATVFTQRVVFVMQDLSRFGVVDVFVASVASTVEV
jgi:hypothetical protein